MPTGPDPKRASKPSRMPSDSVFYEKVMPILFVALGILLLGLILFAAGVLTGIIPWS